MIDYIFYSRNSMRALGLLGQLDPDWIRSNKILGFPHIHVPSDHLPLIVELELFPQTLNGTITMPASLQQQAAISSYNRTSSNNNLINNTTTSSSSSSVGYGQMLPINTNQSTTNNFNFNFLHQNSNRKL